MVINKKLNNMETKNYKCTLHNVSDEDIERVIKHLVECKCIRICQISLKHSYFRISEKKDETFSHRECYRNSPNKEVPLLDLLTLIKKDEPKHEFKPFDRVIVRQNDTNMWWCGTFSHIDDNKKYCSIGGTAYNQCLPYDEYKHLAGTCNNPQ